MDYRKAVSRDIPELIQLRKTQLMDEGESPDQDIDAELDAFFRERLDEGSMVQWVAEEGGEITATGAIIFYRFPPGFANKSGWRGYIANMYTRDEYRGRGLAAKILERLAEEARGRGAATLFLGASEMGRSVYARFGFEPADSFMEMKLVDEIDRCL